MISNGGRFKPASTKRDKKKTMIDLRGESRQTCLKTIHPEGFQDCGLKTSVVLLIGIVFW
jgi:hypothetical protein